MASINFTVHLEYEEVVERLKAEGWVIPVRCGECKHRDEKTGWCEDVQDYISNTNWFCAGGVRKEHSDGKTNDCEVKQ